MGPSSDRIEEGAIIHKQNPPWFWEGIHIQYTKSLGSHECISDTTFSEPLSNSQVHYAFLAVNLIFKQHDAAWCLIHHHQNIVIELSIDDTCL